MSQKRDPQEHDLGQVLLAQLGDKWTMVVLKVLCGSPTQVRFNEIKRQVRGVTQKSLTQCLRRLERNGIVKRNVITIAPLGVEYSISAMGRTLKTPIKALHLWAETHLNDVLKAQAAFDGRTSQRKAPGASQPRRLPPSAA